MNVHGSVWEAHIGFPRFFNIGGFWINSYKFFLIIGIYVGVATSAALAESAGHSPLAVGLAATASALLGLIGARLYHLLIHARYFFSADARHLRWDVRRGGWGVFGALITFVPASFGTALLLGVSAATLWDYMSGGVLARRLLDTAGLRVQRLLCGPRDAELLARAVSRCERHAQIASPGAVFRDGVVAYRRCRIFDGVASAPAAGQLALGVLAWYGTGRSFLEPMREEVDVVFGRVPINQLVAALLAVIAGAALIARL